MRGWKNRGKLALAVLACLLFSGCAGTVEKIGAPDPGAREGSRTDGVAVLAAFQAQGGQAVAEGSARLRAGDREEDYPLDWGGQACFPNLPREGAVGVSLLDGEERVLGSTTLTFSVGAVIDASTDGDGAGYVTLREDTAQVELVFVLWGDGQLRCALRLEP